MLFLLKIQISQSNNYILVHMSVNRPSIAYDIFLQNTSYELVRCFFKEKSNYIESIT